jgi:hypothetical protein
VTVTGDLRLPALECRDFRHAWRTAHVALELNGGVVTRRVECIRCGTTRIDYLVRRTGELSKRSYGYAKGYRVVGQGRLAVADVRREWLNRVLKKKGVKK